MQIRLTFDPFVMEEIDRVRKVVAALSSLESVTTPEIRSVPGKYDRYGHYYRHWLEKTHDAAAQGSVSLIDQVLSFLNEIDAVRKSGMVFSPRYYKNYITLQHGNPSRNFVFLKFFPKKNNLIMKIKIHQSGDIDQLIANAVGTLNYGYDQKGRGWYRVSLTSEKIEQNNEVLEQLIVMSFRQHLS